MRERQGTYDLPKSIEKVVKLEKPKVCMTIKLPYFWEFSSFGRKRYFRNSMHTDTLKVFASTIRELKPQIREELFVEGRVIDESTWKELRKHPAYNFFYRNRSYRRGSSHREKTIRLLMPKTSKVTEEQVRRYGGLDFKPSSLSRRFGFGIGWYPASFLLTKVNCDYFYNSLAPFLSGVNQFRIGSDRLKPGVLWMVGIRMMMDFEHEIHRVADSITSHVDEKVLEASARIFTFER